jgi:hypothetical protein
MMRVGIVACQMQHQQEHAEALSAGLGAHGIASTIYGEGQTPSEPVAACWGWRLGSRMRGGGRDVLVMERGYIGDRMRFASIGWNGLNGRACFPRFVDSARLDPALLKPWNPAGSYVLLIGQCDGDMSIADVDIRAWYRDAAVAIEDRFGLPVKFRPHPDNGERFRVERTSESEGNLQDAMRSSSLVVTYNSNAGVDAMMAGKPTVAMDYGSMAWEVAAHSLYIPAEPQDRRQWAERLASRQWTLDEIRSGAALVPHLDMFRRAKAA